MEWRIGEEIPDPADLQSDYESYTRFSGKMRWHPHKLQRLTVELEASALYDINSFQFYWVNAARPYIAAPGVVTSQRYFYAYIDPKFKYIDKKGNEHKLFYRLYRQTEEQGVSEFWINALYYQFRVPMAYCFAEGVKAKASPFLSQLRERALPWFITAMLIGKPHEIIAQLPTCTIPNRGCWKCSTRCWTFMKRCP